MVKAKAKTKARSKTKSKTNTKKRLNSKRSRAPFSASHYATTPRNPITSVIVIAIIVVIIAVLCAIFLKPENKTQATFENLAKDYYENTFYPNLTSSINYSGDPEKALSPYADTGIAPITLRQLILYDEAATKSSADYLLQYCDENETSVRFYPEPPYERNSYRAVYNYSCDF